MRVSESSYCMQEEASRCTEYLGALAIFGGANPMVDRKHTCR